MFVGQNPARDELRMQAPFIGPASQLLLGEVKKLGLSNYTTHFTYAVKYGTKDFGTPKVSDIRACQKALYDEIYMVQPDVIVPLGASALRAVAGSKYKISAYRGAAFELDYLPGIKVVPTWHPSYIMRNVEHLDAFREDLANALTVLGGGVLKSGEVGEYDLITNPMELQEFLLKLVDADKDQPFIRIAVDCEWHGSEALRNDGYLRLIQMTGAGGALTGVIRLYPEGSPDRPVEPMIHYPDCISVTDTVDILNQFLGAMGSRVGIVGHNVKADGMWLLHYGVDIRPHVFYDTMLAEHLISNLGPFGLSELTLKYTDMGRYDLPVIDFTREHPELIEGGYGFIPDDLLLPYAAGDTMATFRVMEAQKEAIQRCLVPRGLQGQYPSLLAATVRLGSHLYELERTGIPIDLVRLEELTAAYNNKHRQLVSQMQAMAAEMGWLEFNPGSTLQVRNLLFNTKEHNGLGLTPVKSTGKRSKSWEWVMSQSPAKQAEYNASTDKATLELLEEYHPMVRHLLNIRRVDVICKNFLREDKTGGIPGNIYADGRIHPGFGQLTDTGRLNSRNPNVQNWPKASEGYIAEIFSGEEAPKSLRSIILETLPGWVIIEADFKQAELFVLGGMADDLVMLSALNTPGKDLHDITAVDSFGLQVFMPDGSAVDDNAMLALAATDMDAFVKLQKSLVYVDPKGKRMTRDEFKSTIRVSAKAINFGIPYGRGAGAIAMQVNATTGLGVTKEEIQIGLDGWKSTYKVAWACMVRYQTDANTLGYVESPWGRRRHFRKATNRAEEGANAREAANFPIQSTVADTMAIAADRLSNIRQREGLSFRLFNQVHDAFLFALPEGEVEATTKAIHEGMGGIDIPMPSGKPLRLEIDVDVFTRWGEK